MLKFYLHKIMISPLRNDLRERSKKTNFSDYLGPGQIQVGTKSALKKYWL